MKVLVVDDEIAIREWLDMIVGTFPLSIENRFQASNMEEAVDIIKTVGIDVLFTDITMPGKSGLELIHYLREIGYSGRMVICSCHEDFHYAKEALALGVDAYLLKSEMTSDDIINQLKKYELKKASENQIDILGHEESQPFFSDLTMIKTVQEKFNLSFSEPIICFGLMVEPLKLATVNLTDFNYLHNFLLLTFSPGLVLIMANLRHTDVPKRILLQKISEYLQIKGFIKNQYAIANDYYNEHNLKMGVESVLHHLETYYFDGEVTKDISHSRIKSLVQDNLDNGDRESIELAYKIFLSNIPRDIPLTKRFSSDFLDSIVRRFNISSINLNDAHNRIVYSRSFSEIKEILESVISLIPDKIVGNTQIILAMKYIQNNYSKPLSLSDVSKKINLSEEYFSRLFKKETGHNFSEYLNEIRMKKARQLLIYTQKSISEVSEMVGIPNTSYFSQIFKSVFSETPSDYRKNNK